MHYEYICIDILGVPRLNMARKCANPACYHGNHQGFNFCLDCLIKIDREHAEVLDDEE